MLAQLAHVFAIDAERSEDEAEHWRLLAIADELHTRALDAGCKNTGAAAVFGEEKE